jgi:hypothetical protein
MIQEQNLKKSIAKRRPATEASAFCRAIEYRRRADEYINLYLTRFVSSNTLDEDSYRHAVDDYVASVREFDTDICIKETHYPCSCVFDEKGRGNNPRYLKTEALLTHGNAIKESFVTVHRTEKNSFDSRKEEASSVFCTAFKYAQKINYGQYSQFTLLEQNNLEARAISWHQGKKPRRIVVFHTTLSPRSQHILKGVYYYAFKSGIEVWEYCEGRIPRSDIDLSFLKDRIVDCCGIVFLASEQYIPGRDNIEFEIKAANIFRDADDPVKIFPLDLGASKKVMNSISSNEVKARMINDFEKEFPGFLESLSDIYDCRKKRLENDGLWDRLEQVGLNRNKF